jgi:hypothetical protein
MGWQDRDYNPRREEMNAYLGNPAQWMQFAVPLYKSAGLQIRLTFWYFLAVLFHGVEIGQSGEPLYYILIDAAVLLGVLLWHEFGHRVFARMVGGNHWEWVLWPAGGMVPPTCPRTPSAMFLANVGGWVFSLVLLLASLGAVMLIPDHSVSIVTRFGIPVDITGAGAMASMIAAHCLVYSIYIGVLILLINLFPCYWFDGGYLWQSVLWPWLGQWKATRVTCLAGMILVVPLAGLAIMGRDFLSLVVLAFIFADCFNRRRALAAAGPGVMDEDDGPSYNYMDTPTPRKKIKKKWFKSARKKAVREQVEQAKIDAILAKVKEKGLHSLSWGEKRTLKKATQRQRQQDLAGRY